MIASLLFADDVFSVLFKAHLKVRLCNIGYFTGMTVTQETGVQVLPDTKHHKPFPNTFQVDVVPLFLNSTMCYLSLNRPKCHCCFVPWSQVKECRPCAWWQEAWGAWLRGGDLKGTFSYDKMSTYDKMGWKQVDFFPFAQKKKKKLCRVVPEMFVFIYILRQEFMGSEL